MICFKLIVMVLTEQIFFSNFYDINKNPNFCQLILSVPSKNYMSKKLHVKKIILLKIRY